MTGSGIGRRALAITAALAIGGTAWLACVPGAEPAGEDGRNGPDQAAADSIRIRHALERDLTGDGIPERLEVLATGPAYDSLDIRLTIRSLTDTLLYAARWRSALYFVYDDRTRIRDSVIAERVREHLSDVLAANAFHRGPPVLWQSERERNREVRESIRYSVAEDIWRERHGVPVGDTLPHQALAEIAAMQPPNERVDALVRELRDRPAFAYFAGGEATYHIAWSPSERKFHVLFSCC
ncbi:MAG TPA: hypothetical protein VMM18_17065 [Gemmatimonadaceae bacterium]|nr:hypothetical protein [Gemmatimonadaceae bacterium]